MKKLINCIFITLFLINTNLCRAEPPAKTRLCSRCHGEAGNSMQPRYPKLAGQHSAYLIKQLHDFQAGIQGPRPNPLMLTIVQELSETEIIQLAQYFAAQPASAGWAQNTNLALGRKLYKSGDRAKGIPACSACHSPTGEGNAAARFPRVGGQHARYIALQLEHFQSQKRHNDPRSIMRDIAAKLSPAEIAAAANYMSGLHE